MKILQIIPYFPPSPLDFGSGVVHVVYHMSKELVKRGHDVTICTSAFANDVESAREIRGLSNPTTIDGIKVLYFTYPVSYRNFFLTPKIVWYLKNHIAAFDVAHLHDVRCFQSIVTHRYARKSALPYVLQPHGSYLGTFGDNKFKWLLDYIVSRKVLRDASRVIALTSTEAEYYSRNGIAVDKIDIVSNGIDLSKFGRAQTKGKFRKKFGIDTNELVVLYVGRMAETKGLVLLIEAFSDLHDQFTNAKLVLIGPDSFGYESTLKKKTRDLQIQESTLFCGPIDEFDKINAYADADVFVTPQFTGFPLTFLESCACGTPIVTTDKGDAIDWINGQVGYVTGYNKTELKDGITRILSEDRTRAEFKDNCRKLAQRFAWPPLVDKIEDTYRRAAHT